MDANDKNFGVFYQLSMKSWAIVWVLVATIIWNAEVVVVAIKVCIFARLVNICRENNTTNSDIMKLREGRNLSKSRALQVFVLVYCNKKGTSESLLKLNQLWVYRCSMFSSYICCWIVCFVINDHFFCIPLAQESNVKALQKISR